MIVDITYPIETWPRQNELTHITGEARRTIGGAVCNVLLDLARLDPMLPLMASGLVGHDAEGDLIMEEMGRYPNLDLSMIRRDSQTSFTIVMSDHETKERTFFQYAGASAEYGRQEIEWDRMDADIFHMGYILLLPYLDEPDEEYGTRMARLLHLAREHGLKTSIDVVSEAGERFECLVPPALKYTDYCIINELEAQQITGVLLRDENGRLHQEHMKEALFKLRALGVSTWAVIHCPELGCGIDERESYCEFPSLTLPKGFIKGTVGAGDAFCAGVLYAAETGMPLSEGLKLGSCTAAASLSKANASDGVQTKNEVLKLYEKYGNNR